MFGCFWVWGSRESGRRNPESGIRTLFSIIPLIPCLISPHFGWAGFPAPNHNPQMTNLETTSGFAGKTHTSESRMMIAHARLGKKHTAETRAKMSQNSGRKRPVYVEGVMYESLHSAAVALGLLDQTLMMRIKRNTPGYAYAEF